MNLVQLKRMIAIYECGSLRKAAATIGITQPALTLSIKQLEEEFNASLFERGPSGVRPTAMCERLVARARLMLAEERRIVHELTEANRQPRLALGVHPVLVSEWLTHTLRRFVDASPRIDLWVRDGYTTQLMDMLSAGDLDFAFCGFPADFSDEAFEFEPLFRRNYAIVARADHAIFAGAGTSGHTWVQLSAYNKIDPMETREFTEMIGRFGYGQDNKIIRVSSATLHKSLIVDGGLIGMIACESVAAELIKGTLMRLEGSEIAAPTFGFVTLQGRYETRIIRHLKSVIRANAQSAGTA